MRTPSSPAESALDKHGVRSILTLNRGRQIADVRDGLCREMTPSDERRAHHGLLVSSRGIMTNHRTGPSITLRAPCRDRSYIQVLTMQRTLREQRSKWKHDPFLRRHVEPIWFDSNSPRKAIGPLCNGSGECTPRHPVDTMRAGFDKKIVQSGLDFVG